MLSATAVVSLTFMVALEGVVAHRMHKVQHLASSSDAVSSSAGSSSGSASGSASSSRETFQPIGGHHKHAKLQSGFSHPTRVKPQHSVNDKSPGGAADESSHPPKGPFKGELDSRSELMSLEKAMAQDGDLDSRPIVAPELMPLEKAMTQNPYLGMMSEEEMDSINSSWSLKEFWTEVEKFVQDCEQEMLGLRYMRSTFVAFFEGLGSKTSLNADEMKMLHAKTQLLTQELSDNNDRGMELLSRSQALAQMVKVEALANVNGKHPPYSKMQIEAMSTCHLIQTRAAEDTKAELEKTQDRLVTLFKMRQK
jgi:hypothetical protein